MPFSGRGGEATEGGRLKLGRTTLFHFQRGVLVEMITEGRFIFSHLHFIELVSVGRRRVCLKRTIVLQVSR